MYTNFSNISLPVAVWLAADDGYDLIPDPDKISATSFLKPLKSVILEKALQAANQEGIVDLSDLVASRVGTAVHKAAEVAWLYSREKAIKNLALNSKVYKKIRLNADNEDEEDAIYIYLEKRSERVLDGITVSGKFDFVYEGRVIDLKTTKTYNWIARTNDDKYVKQGSIYRWLNRDIITDDYINVEMIFTDWSPFKALADKTYPQHRVCTRTLPLMSIPETEHFLKTCIARFKKYRNSNQKDLPDCLPEEIWMDEAKWAYYKNPKATTRATKLFDNEGEAVLRKAADGGLGLIVKRLQEPKFCNYCPARQVCHQAEKYERMGILKI